MRKNNWWVILLILALLKVWNAYQKQQALDNIKQTSVSTVTVKSEMYQGGMPTGDIMYWKLSGEDANDLANTIVKEVSFAGDGYEVKTGITVNITPADPLICSMAFEGVKVTIYSKNTEWGESTCDFLRDEPG